MANINKLSWSFVDNQTTIYAEHMNGIVSAINSIIDALDENSGGGSTPEPTPTPETVATPTISISGTAATISCSTSGATIYYTTNGNTPTTSSTQYSSPITLSGACTIKAIAVKSGMNNSSVASQPYTPAATVQSPTIYIRDLAIVMDAESGATIYYTTDGSTPTSSSTQYTNAFTNANDCTVKAIAIKNGSSSSVASASFTAPQRTDQAYPQIVIEGNKATILSNGVGTLTYALGDDTTYVNYTGPITLTEATTVKGRTRVSSNMQCGVKYTGTESVIVSLRPTNIVSGLVNYNDSSASSVVLKASSTYKIVSYPIASGRHYELLCATCPTSSAFWVYGSSMPSEGISADTTITGKLDKNLVPASEGTDDVQNLAITSAENYAYLLVTQQANFFNANAREVLKS